MRLQKKTSQEPLYRLIQQQPISIHLVDNGLEEAHNKLKSKYKRLKFLSMLEAVMLIVAGASLILF